jgi:phage tail-like protein
MSGSAYYPPPAFAFSAAVVSGPGYGPAAGIDSAFMEISGIDPKMDLEEVVEGGVNSHVHYLPGVTKHSNLVLKRGYVTQSSSLATWASQTVGSTLGSPIQTQTLNVYLLGPNGQPLVTWTFLNAWPVKWEVGTFDSQNSNAVLTQTLEIAYTTVSATLSPSQGTA